MGSHFRVNATPVTFTFTIPPVSVTKIGPSWWNRLRKQPFVDWIVKLMARTLIKELFERVLDLYVMLNIIVLPSREMAAQQFFCNFRVGCGTGSSSLGSRVQKAVAREPLAVNLSKATSRSIKMRGRSSLHYSQRAIQRPHLLLQEKRPCQKPSEPRSRAAPYREPSLI